MQIKQEFLSKTVRAEAFFQVACEHLRRSGEGDKLTALNMYVKAAGLGSAKALLHIGLMLRDDPTLMGTPKEGRRQMARFFSRAGKKGCPEGYFRLYQEFSEGKRLKKNPRAAERYLVKAASEGSPKAFVILGKRAVSRGDVCWGRHLLEKARRQGSGDACFYLAMYYATVSKQPPLVLQYLREGGRMGCAKCLQKLAQIYSLGKYGLTPNQEYAEQLTDLSEKTHPELPAPIRNFNSRFPHVVKWMGDTI